MKECCVEIQLARDLRRAVRRARNCWVWLHPNVVMPAKKQELEIAGNKVIMETRRVVEIPKILGVLLVVAGGAILFLSQVNPSLRRR